MANRAATMCEGEFDFGFAVDWMRKDLGICFDEANSNGARLPVTAFGGSVLCDGAGLWRQALGHFGACPPVDERLA